MKKMILDLPDFLDYSSRDLKMILAVNLYKKGSLTLGQAADVVGLTKRAFIESIGKYNVSVFNYAPDEIESDLNNA